MKRNNLLWHDRKRNFLGLPWSFTVYGLDKNRLFIERGFLSTTDDEVRLYRITDMSPLSKCNNDRPSYAWMNVAKDKSEALLSYVQVRGGANIRSEVLYLQGLQPDAVYALDDGREYSGEELMYAGFVTDQIWGDGASALYHFCRRD